MKNCFNAPSSQKTTLAISMAVLLSTPMPAIGQAQYSHANFVSSKSSTVRMSRASKKHKRKYRKYSKYRKYNRNKHRATARRIASKKHKRKYRKHSKYKRYNKYSTYNGNKITAQQLGAIKRQDLEYNRNWNNLTAQQLGAIKKQDLEYNRNWNNLTAQQLHAIKKQDLERSKKSQKYRNTLTAQQLHAIKKQDLEFNRNKNNLTAQQLGAVNLNILEKLETTTQPVVTNKTVNTQATVHKRGIQSLQELNNQFTIVPEQANTTPLQPLNDGIIAVVNNKPILKSQLQQTMQRLKNMYLSNGQKAPNDNELKNQALKQLIIRELQLDMVRKIGIRPSNQALQNSLLNYAKEQGFSNLLQLQKSMEAKERGSYALLVTAITDDLAIKILQQSQVARQINITDNDVQAFLTSTEGQMLNKNSYQTIHIRVPFANAHGVNKNKTVAVAKIIQNELRLTSNATDKTIAKIIAKAQANYPVEILGGNMGYHKPDTLPAGLTNTIVNLNIGQVAVVQTDLGIEVIKLVNKKVTDNLLIPQWHTRHILVAVTPYQNSEMAQYKINKIYNQLVQGRDFAHLAANYSNDPSSAGKGGDLSWVSEGNMVAEFEKVMKATPTGKFSKPFKTTYGWHILQVVDTRKFDASNDVRKKMAKEILFKREAPQIRERWLEDLRNSSYVKFLE